MADAVRQTFEREGIEVLAGTSVERAEPIASGGVLLHLHTAGIWAVGDINGGPEFTHVSLDDYRIVKAQITGVGDHTSTADRILTSYNRVRVARLAADTIGMPRAQTTGQTEGFLKAVVDAATDRILGTAFFVAVASEMTAVMHLVMSWVQ